MSVWMLKKTKTDCERMGKALGLNPVVAQALANRGITDETDVKDFLTATLDDLYPPEKMRDMDKGCRIIKQKAEKGEKIAVYGDYDADGVTSGVILYKTIKRIGGEPFSYIPDRKKEGYGLNVAAVEKLFADGFTTLLTCDNGISANEEIKRAKELGMTVVVIDHHEPKRDERGEILPPADAVIDPKVSVCDYPFKMLCAAGICYKFALRLLSICGARDAQLEKELLALATIATVCDLVDLIGENRIIVKNGLEIIKQTQNKGLNALIKAANLWEKDITEYSVGFVIGPCINSAGRLSHASIAFKLLTDEDNAEETALRLKELNDKRKRLTEDAAKIANEAIETRDMLNDKVLVVNAEADEGVIGIAAGRLKEQYHRPIIYISEEGEIAKGSARSIEGYNIFEELLKCDELFERFGGHAMAAGFSLKKENVAVLRQRLNEECRLTQKQLTPKLWLEGRLNADDVTFSLIEELESLAPFGKGNPTPIFGDKRLYVNRITLIGKNKDIMRLSLSTPSGKFITAVSFNGYKNFYDETFSLYGAEKCAIIFGGGKADIWVDIAYYPQINAYNGNANIQLVIEDIRHSKVS